MRKRLKKCIRWGVTCVTSNTFLDPFIAVLSILGTLIYTHAHAHTQTTKRTVPMLFVRGDGVILISPPLRAGL